MFIDRDKRIDIIENWKTFLKTILDLKSCLVEFDSKIYIKNKMYPNDYQVEDRNHQPIIVIINNKYKFSINNKKTHR